MDSIIRDIIIASGIPDEKIAVSHFSKPVSLPYAVYTIIPETSFIADDKIYWGRNAVSIEIYMDGYRDDKLIDNIKSELNKMEIIYDITDEYINGENLYMCTIEFEMGD